MGISLSMHRFRPQDDSRRHFAVVARRRFTLLRDPPANPDSAHCVPTPLKRSQPTGPKAVTGIRRKQKPRGTGPSLETSLLRSTRRIRNCDGPNVPLYGRGLVAGPGQHRNHPGIRKESTQTAGRLRLYDLRDIDQVQLAAIAAVRRVDHHLPPVGAESGMCIATPLALVLVRG